MEVGSASACARFRNDHLLVLVWKAQVVAIAPCLFTFAMVLVNRSNDALYSAEPALKNSPAPFPRFELQHGPSFSL
eukprot:5380198-Amphidinium_carterae.1